MLVHLPGEHTAEIVRDGLAATRGLCRPPAWFADLGPGFPKMARDESFSLATDMAVFCDPASPWQRGSNENTTELLRQYLSKGARPSVHGPEDVEHVAQVLNGRPRKTLGWDTSAERFA